MRVRGRRPEATLPSASLWGYLSASLPGLPADRRPMPASRKSPRETRACCRTHPSRGIFPARRAERDPRLPLPLPSSASWGLRRALPPVGPGGFGLRSASLGGACGRLPLPPPRPARKRQPRPDGPMVAGEGCWERARLPKEAGAGRSVAEEAGARTRCEGAGAGGRGRRWQAGPFLPSYRCWRPNRSSLPSSTASYAANLRLSPDQDFLPAFLQTFPSV